MKSEGVKYDGDKPLMYLLKDGWMKAILTMSAKTSTIGPPRDRHEVEMFSDYWLSTFPNEAIGYLETAKVLTMGAKKYSPDNWMKVSGAVKRYQDAFMRHLAAWRSGEEKDPESGLDHRGHMLCCLMFLWMFMSGQVQEVPEVP